MTNAFATIKWFARGSAELLGWATAISLVFFWITVAWYERTTDVRYAAAPIPVSPVASKIAAKFSPALQDLAEEHEDEVVASAGNVAYRFAARQVYPSAVKAIPRATEIGADKALTYLDTMPMSEVAGLMIEHAKTSGCPVHYSVWAAAEAGPHEQKR